MALAGLGAALVALGVVHLKSRSWQLMNRLQTEMSAAQAKTFHLALEARSRLILMNGDLLRFQLSKDDQGLRENFLRQADQLTDFIRDGIPRLATEEERRLAGRLEGAVNAYLTNAYPLLDRQVKAVRRDTAAALHQEIARLAQPPIEACEELAQAQHRSWAGLVAETRRVLGALERLLQASILMHVALALCLVLLIYRALVAPLRQELDQTRVVMERQQKLAALGTLAAGVAHELRNPLTAIKFRLFSLRQSMAGALAANEDVRVIDDEINRLERIVRDFLQFARPSEPQCEVVSAGRLLEKTRNLLQPELARRSIQLTLEETDSAKVRADPHQVDQVLINLVQNAADSIQGPGRITLRARQTTARFGGHSAAAVVLEIEDTGKGIPPEVEPRMFDPFYSTKEGGTGLGLPTAAQIVEKHGGLIQYQTQPGKGTRFQVLLPRCEANAGKNPAH